LLSRIPAEIAHGGIIPQFETLSVDLDTAGSSAPAPAPNGALAVGRGHGVRRAPLFL
jgi:hypothetical protein